MSYMKEVWKDVAFENDTKYKIEVCCKALVSNKHITKEDSLWKCWSDEGELVLSGPFRTVDVRGIEFSSDPHLPRGAAS